jgi:hypothetical protein
MYYPKSLDHQLPTQVTRQNHIDKHAMLRIKRDATNLLLGDSITEKSVQDTLRLITLPSNSADELLPSDKICGYLSALHRELIYNEYTHEPVAEKVNPNQYNGTFVLQGDVAQLIDLAVKKVYGYTKLLTEPPRDLISALDQITDIVVEDLNAVLIHNEAIRRVVLDNVPIKMEYLTEGNYNKRYTIGALEHFSYCAYIGGKMYMEYIDPNDSNTQPPVNFKVPFALPEVYGLVSQCGNDLLKLATKLEYSQCHLKPLVPYTVGFDNTEVHSKYDGVDELRHRRQSSNRRGNRRRMF